MRALLAEFFGTFTLVFIGTFAVTIAPQFGVVVPALAHGLIIVGLAAAYGAVSGGHFNPAVTLAMIVGGKINLVKAALYMAVQFGGGIVAAFLLVALLPDAGNFGQTTGSLTAGSVWQAAVIEAVLTFFLVSTIFQAAVYGHGGPVAPLAIGLTLTACILAGGVYTGASLNPARTLGPALAAGDLSYLLPYLVGTFGGGAVGGAVHTFLMKPGK
ncbi:MAG: aquaporin [Anaerolineae bacterium]|jgi:aquaporin Z|nr:aquaporin [Anaerolineae bacterium]